LIEAKLQCFDGMGWKESKDVVTVQERKKKFEKSDARSTVHFTPPLEPCLEWLMAILAIFRVEMTGM
jgi:hypothetical protein